MKKKIAIIANIGAGKTMHAEKYLQKVFGQKKKRRILYITMEHETLLQNCEEFTCSNLDYLYMNEIEEVEEALKFLKGPFHAVVLDEMEAFFEKFDTDIDWMECRAATFKTSLVLVGQYSPTVIDDLKKHSYAVHVGKVQDYELPKILENVNFVSKVKIHFIRDFGKRPFQFSVVRLK